MRTSLRISLALFLISPYLIWLLWISKWNWPSLHEWLPVLAISAQQALFSSFFSLVFGFFLFLGLQAWSTNTYRKMSELSLLLPNMIPAPFLVLSLFSWVTPWTAFPFGMGAVIFAHVLINSGLVAIALDRLGSAGACAGVNGARRA